MNLSGDKIRTYLKDALNWNTCLYNIPTIMRKDGGHLNSNPNLLGVIGTVIQAGIYSKLIQEGIPAYLLPAITNVLSGIYEAGNYIHNKAEKKLIAKKNKLENKLDE